MESRACGNWFAVLSAVIRGCLGLLIGLCAEYSYAEDQISFGSLSFTYDSECRLSEVYSNGMRIVMNKYDYMGRRVKKITMDAERIFIYDDWRPVIERIVWADGRMEQMEYFWGKDVSGVLDGAGGVGGLLYVRKNSTEIFVPLYDAQGNVIAYVDQSGEVVANYTYDAFGNTIMQTGARADELNIRFSTKYFDEESQLYYFGKRYYCPQIARWMTRDPAGEDASLNLYAYCGNDGMNRIDPYGDKIAMSIGRRLNEKRIPVTGNGSGRGRTVTSLKNVVIRCKSCRLDVRGKYVNIMYILEPKAPAWSMRLSRYDKKWGSVRSNAKEREATIAHENDHWRAWSDVEKYINMVNEKDGKFLFFCKTRASKMQEELRKLAQQAEIRDKSFDAVP